MLILIFYVLITKQSPILNDPQKLLSTLINDIRTSPRNFSKYLKEQFIKKFKNKIYDDLIETKEGIKAFKDSIQYLDNIVDGFALDLSPQLSYLAEKHSLYMKSKDELDHFQEGKNLIDILQENGSILGKASQLVYKIKKNIGSLIILLGFIIADDGIFSRGNRNSILDNKFEQIGIGIVEDELDCFITIILVEDFQSNNQLEIIVREYKAIQQEFEIIKKDQEFLKNLDFHSEFNFSFKKQEKDQKQKKPEKSISEENSESPNKILAIQKLYSNLNDLSKAVKNLNQLIFFYKNGTQKRPYFTRKIKKNRFDQ